MLLECEFINLLSAETKIYIRIILFHHCMCTSASRQLQASAQQVATYLEKLVNFNELPLECMFVHPLQT